MRTVQTLLAEACAKCGKQRELCRLIGLKPPQISSMRAGRIPISPQTVGLLCNYLDLPPDEAQRLAAEAVVNNARPERKATLMRAFFGLSIAGAALLLSPDNATALMTPSDIEASIYTLCTVMVLRMLEVSLRHTLCGATPQATRVRLS